MEYLKKSGEMTEGSDDGRRKWKERKRLKIKAEKRRKEGENGK